MKEKVLDEKGRFLVKNIFRGLLFLALLIIAFQLFKQVVSEEQRQDWFGHLFENPQLVIVVYICSEIFFGIIPPETFMLWSLQTGNMGPYLPSLVILSVISYAAGYLNFVLGNILRNKGFFQKLKNKHLRKYHLLLQKHGAYLIIAASVSPLPFAAVALLSGIVGIKRRKYILYSLFRIVRFLVYGMILWEVKGF